MTKIVYKKHKNVFKFIKISGHSGFDSYGNDIVCAGISSIVEGCCSFFNTYYSDLVSIDKNEAFVFIKIKNCGSEEVQLCLKMMIHQLRNIQFFYPQNLSFEN